MITREQIQDLQPGDVVELRHRLFPEITLRGPISASGARGYDLVLPPVWIRSRDGEPGEDLEIWGTLTVVSRAPRPLYVNHPRTEPVMGDVVRDAKGVIRFSTVSTVSNDEPAFWSYDYEPGWRWTWTTNPPKPLTLLVDGETGMTVPQ